MRRSFKVIEKRKKEGNRPHGGIARDRKGPRKSVHGGDKGPLRGIEAALEVWREVRRGRFASESLRSISDRVSEKDRPLAATLVYSLIRRESLWKEIVGRFLKTGSSGVSPAVRDALMVGAAGSLELRTFEPRVLVNALVEWTKCRDERGSKVVNAVLRRIVEGGPEILAEIERSVAFSDLAMRSGVPLWAAKSWESSFGRTEGRALIELHSQPVSLALRLSPGVDRSEMVQRLEEGGFPAVESPDLPFSVRLEGTALPTGLPGYEEGKITPQSESSMAVSLAFTGRGKFSRLLDMCAGRGGKTGQLAQAFPEASLEGWDLSGPRIKAAVKEMKRLGISDRVKFSVGDSLELEPSFIPDGVLLDAPCSGSGTWRRHPESKWRLSQDELARYGALQAKLLGRALDLVSTGGTVLYCTCSLFREENEQVVAKAMSVRSDVVELEPPHELVSRCRKGRPWGYYTWPDNPWTDGFYMALLTVTA
jgi:16S rRNA (cytosine967-C5)-methyltransferase